MPNAHALPGISIIIACIHVEEISNDYIEVVILVFDKYFNSGCIDVEEIPNYPVEVGPWFKKNISYKCLHSML